MLSIVCIEGVWKVLVECLESASRVSERRMEGVSLAIIGGCLEGVWRKSGRCLKLVWKVSGRSLEGVWKAHMDRFGPIWPQ